MRFSWGRVLEVGLPCRRELGVPRFPVTADADEVARPQGGSRDAVLVAVHYACGTAICDPLQDLRLCLVQRSGVHGFASLARLP
jgi:hypothetical protein